MVEGRDRDQRRMEEGLEGSDVEMASVMKERGIKSRERSKLSVVFAARRRSFSEGLNAPPQKQLLMYTVAYRYSFTFR